MAVRLRWFKGRWIRNTWSAGKWIALCAAKSEEKEGDVYIDDSQDHALRRKYIADYTREGLIERRNEMGNENPRLENWGVVMDNRGNSYLHPGACWIVLSGIVTGHPNLPDGGSINTSSVQSIDLDKNEARTKSRKYSLGEPSPGFLEYIESIDRTLRDYHKPEETTQCN
jgi:hypothetical protein